MWWVLLILSWIICGILAWGILFVDFQEEYKSISIENYRNDLGFAIFTGMWGGPVALVVAFFTTDFSKHGLRWW